MSPNWTFLQDINTYLEDAFEQSDTLQEAELHCVFGDPQTWLDCRDTHSRQRHPTDSAATAHHVHLRRSVLRFSKSAQRRSSFGSGCLLSLDVAQTSPFHFLLIPSDSSAFSAHLGGGSSVIPVSLK